MWAGLRQTNRRTRNETNLTLTLTPKSGDARLDILVISKFPFLVSNATFSRYKREHGEELSNLSPLHASISHKAGLAYIEDLGSSHGTFVDGVRLREHAVPLQDGVVIAFGGKHFVYEVSISRQSASESAEGGAGPAVRRQASRRRMTKPCSWPRRAHSCKSSATKTNRNARAPHRPLRWYLLPLPSR